MNNRFLRGFRSATRSAGSGGGGGGVPTSRAINAGSGLTGGGTLAADRTISLDPRYLADLQQQNISAAGASQAAATPIVNTSKQVYVNGGAANQGVRLPLNPVVGDIYTIVVASSVLGNPNSGTGISIYPGVGDTFRNRTANTPITLFAFQTMRVRCIAFSTTATWEANIDLGFYDGTAELAITPTIDHYGIYVNTSSIQVYGNLQFFNGAPLVFNGTTGQSVIKCLDNLAEGLWLGEGSNRYITLVTTDNAEGVIISKPLWGYQAKINVQTTSYTVDATNDTGKIVEINSGSATNCTLPATAPVGTCVTVAQTGAGQITFISTGSGTVVNASSQFKSRVQESVVTAYVTTNVGGSAAKWRLSGDTAA